MREKVFFDLSLSRKQLMKKFNLPQTTAQNAKKRGYISIRTKPTKVDENKFNLDLATQAAEYIFFSKFRHRLEYSMTLKNDLIQEGLLRIFETSGLRQEGNEFNYYCKIATNAMFSYLTKNHIIGTWRGREESFEENVLGYGIYA